MLSETILPATYGEWVKFIQVPEVRAAFRTMLGHAACSQRFTCHAQWKGEIRDFRLYDQTGEQPFSAIINQKWLLFYFRKPAIRGKFDLREQLESMFPTLKENPAGEWTIQIQSSADVDKLFDIIDS